MSQTTIPTDGSNLLPLGPWTEADAAAAVRDVKENTRRPRRSRRYSGWRARAATWLRRLAEWLNPLEEP